MIRPAILVMAVGVVVVACEPVDRDSDDRDPDDGPLQVTPLVRLDSRLGDFTPSTSQSVLRGPDGRYLVSHLALSSPAIAMYDSDGGWIGLYDREGRGPGELSSPPRLLPGPAESIYVVEGHRMLEFDSDLNVLSTKRTDLRVDMPDVAVLPSGQIALSYVFRTDGGDVYTVALLGRDGSLLEPVQKAANPFEADRSVGPIVAPSASGGFWTLSIGSLRLREYSSEGELVRTLTIRSEGFVPWEEPLEGEGWSVRPRPRHAELRDPGDGTLILVTRIPDPEWTPIDGGVVNFTNDDPNGRWDSVVQLVDANSGEVLAERRVPEMLRPVRGAQNLLRSVHLDEFGHVETRVWKVASGPF